MIVFRDWSSAAAMPCMVHPNADTGAADSLQFCLIPAGVIAAAPAGGWMVGGFVFEVSALMITRQAKRKRNLQGDEVSSLRRLALLDYAFALIVALLVALAVFSAVFWSDPGCRSCAMPPDSEWPTGAVDCGCPDCSDTNGR